ncbi:unnamed protein product [Symbiodinium natans]|uniref:Sulfotransferase domain-containing protein n=1 Tax=Symbiodinium natans TaxID=878477 RepID=A0A812Q513_9DINO|nr:unnamed protein product [Symbiodinium natans]
MKLSAILATLVFLAAVFLLVGGIYRSHHKFLGQTLHGCTNYGSRDVPRGPPSQSDIGFSKQLPAHWLRTIVIPDAKLIFCPQYKVGTREYLRLLQWLDGQDYNRRPQEQTHSVRRNSFNLTELEEFGNEAALRMMFDSDWAKLVVVRDPLDRLRSAYFDKIRREKAPTKFAKALNVPVQALKNLSFAAFVRRVGAQMKRKVANIHWGMQAQACGLRRFKKCYQYVLHMGLDKGTHPMLRDCVLRIMVSRRSDSKLPTPQDIVASDTTKGILQRHQTDSSLDIFDKIYDKAGWAIRPYNPHKQPYKWPV